MDTSEHQGTPPSDAIAQVVAPTLVGRNPEQMLLPGQRLAAIVGRHVASLTPGLERMAAHVSASVVPGVANIIATLMRNQQTMDRARATLAAQGAMMAQAVAASRLDQEWLDRIAADLGTAPIPKDAQGDLADALDRLYDAEEHTDAQDLPEVLPAEIEEQGRTFVRVEGVGLSEAAQRRLFMWWVYLAIASALATAYVSDSAVKEALDTAFTVSPIAVGVMVAAGASWDRMRKRPEDGEGEDAAAGAREET
ncbi:hypothetical protein OG939_36080 [Streptomyces sp. NBC_01685]|uniref:hypothetical protein n=1 Tax=Streptomyces sp. NBC_01685 TaxID=2975910 RepID=UPI002E312074|nr:hypothetical protein [Streptomyces sp. NBC_01685]